jgi:hypothetical protein
MNNINNEFMIEEKNNLDTEQYLWPENIITHQELLNQWINDGQEVINQQVEKLHVGYNFKNNKRQAINNIQEWLTRLKSAILETFTADTQKKWEVLLKSPHTKKTRIEEKFLTNLYANFEIESMNIEEFYSNITQLLEEIGDIYKQQCKSIYEGSWLTTKEELLKQKTYDLEEKQSLLTTSLLTTQRTKYWAQEIINFLNNSELHKKFVLDIKDSINDINNLMKPYHNKYIEHLNSFANNIYSILKFTMTKANDLDKDPSTKNQKLYKKLLKLAEKQLLKIEESYFNYIHFIHLQHLEESVEYIKSSMQDILQQQIESGLISANKVTPYISELIEVDFFNISKESLKATIIASAMREGLYHLNEKDTKYLSELSSSIKNQYINNNPLDFIEHSQSKSNQMNIKINKTNNDDEKTKIILEQIKIEAALHIAIIDQTLLKHVIDSDWNDWLKPDIEEIHDNNPETDEIMAKHNIERAFNITNEYLEHSIFVLMSMFKEATSISDFKSTINSIGNTVVLWTPNMISSIMLDTKEKDLPEELEYICMQAINNFFFTLKQTFDISA